MAEEKKERYVLEVDFSQAITNYDKVIVLTKIYEDTNRRAVGAINDLAKAQAVLAASAGKGAKDREKAARAVERAQMAVIAAIGKEERASKALAKQINKVDQERSEAAKRAHKLAELDRKTQDNLRKAELAATKAKEKAGREIGRQIKSTSTLRGRIHDLVREMGTLTAEFDENGEAANEHARKLKEITDESKELTREIERLAGAGGGATTTITPADTRDPASQVGLSAFQVRQLGTAFDRLGIRGAGAISNIVSAFAGMSPALIATAAGVIGLTFGVIKLTQAMVKLGVAGTKAFIDILKSSVELAAKFDSVEKSFTAVFEGSAEAGKLLSDQVRAASIRLGIDAEEIVRKVLPLVSSVNQALQVAQLATGLAQLDPKLGEQGAVRVIQAALAADSSGVGNLQPLRKSFDIDVNPIKEAQRELGTTVGLLVGLGEVLESRGLDFETMSETFILQTGAMRQRWEDFQITLGEPIVAESIVQLKDIGETLDSKQHVFQIVANAIGEISARVVELAGVRVNEFLEGFDEEDAREIAAIFVDIGDALGGFIASVDGEDIADFLGKIASAMGVIADAAAIAIGPLQTFLAINAALLGAVSLNPLDMAKQLGAAYVEIRDAQEEWGETVDEVNAKIGESNALTELEIALLEAEQDAILALNVAKREEAEARNALDDAKTEEHEDRLDAQKNFEQDIAEIELKAERDRLRADERRSQSRIDAERKFQQDLEDFREKKERKKLDDSITLNRKEADIERKHEDALLDIDSDASKKREDLEQKHLDKLAEIRRKADFDAEEAIRNNDAVALLRIRRRMQFQLDEEDIRHSSSIDKEEEAAQEKRQAQRDARERELREARIDDDRRIADRKRAFDREREDINKNLERKLEAISIEYKRRREEIKKNLEQEMLDRKAARDEALIELRADLDDEIQAVKDAQAQIEKVIIESYRRIAAIKSQALALSGPLGGFGGPGETPGLGGVPLGGTGRSSGGGGGDPLDPDKGEAKARGGPIFAGQPVIIGDPDPARPNQPNPELVIPTTNGMVIPTNRLMYSPPSAGAGVSNIFNNQRSVEIDSVGGGVGDLSPAAERRVRNIIVETMQEALGG